MSADQYIFDWSDLAFASKKPLRELDATFIPASREISDNRLTELVKTYLSRGNLIIGIAKELYIDGFDGQLAFRTLHIDKVKNLAEKVAASNSPRKLYVLQYFQRELDYILEKIKPRNTVLVNGSWRQAFHTRSTYYVLTRNGLPYEHASPFASRAEAEQFAERFPPILPSPGAAGDVQTMLLLAQVVARNSFDTTYQTGCVLAKPHYKGYEVVTSGYNRVIPYQTYALHNGSSRERNFSVPNDANHYDTIHAEMTLLINTLRSGIDMTGLTMFITTLPCPNCARTLSQTGLGEVVYENDHSDGYAVKLLDECGIKTRRVVV